jgi:hypothetical protein
VEWGAPAKALFRFVADPRQRMRLAAIRSLAFLSPACRAALHCLTLCGQGRPSLSLFLSLPLLCGGSGQPGGHALQATGHAEAVRRVVLPGVLQLLAEDEGLGREAAPAVLAALISGDEALAEAAGTALLRL